MRKNSIVVALKNKKLKMALTFVGTNPLTGDKSHGIVRDFDTNRRPQWVRGRFDNDATWRWYDIEHCNIQIAYPDILSPFVGPKISKDIVMPSAALRIPRVDSIDLTGSELFCGSGRVAHACERNGMQMNRLDWLLKPGPNVFNDDFAVINDADIQCLFGVDYIHASPDCRTYSQLTASVNQRNMQTNFLGKTEDAFQANAVLLKLFSCLQVAIRDNPKLIFTIENPEATFDLHPLVQRMCQPVKKGGIGATIVRFSFCAFGERVRKNSVLITNSPTTIAAMQSDTFRCARNVQCDFSKRPHEGVSKRSALVGIAKHKKRVVVGHETKDVTAFPLLFTEFLSNCVLQDLRPSRCTNAQCNFSLKHAGICSHMHVCKK